jgi:thermostable 8-oxoguanine DNA glycosylase
MNISWNITEKDIQRVKEVMTTNENAFVKKRRERNVEKQNIVINKESIIKTMMMCLLTSQQRSGPDTKVGKFLLLEPFPITLDSLENVDNIQKGVKKILKNNRLTRFINRISSFFASNLEKIESENWAIIQELNELKDKDSKKEERDVSDRLAEKFKGFGPKQSRNFLQALGLTKYEIPIDSRITNWLNDFGFPVSLTSSPLGDKGYYHFVSDGIQELCEKAEIYPCLLDAAIFSSFDDGAWTAENSRFKKRKDEI